MKHKRFLSLAISSFAVATALTLSACGGTNDAGEQPGDVGATYVEAGNGNDTGNGNDNGNGVQTTSNNPFQPLEDALQRVSGTHIINDNPIIDGGTLRFAIASANTIPGIFGDVFWLSGLDADIREFTHEPLFTAGWDLNISNVGGLATVYVDREASTVTIVKNHQSYWHDGTPVTLDDLVFAHEIIAHPDYTGPRWGHNVQNIVGAVEFRNGEADYISGLTLSEDKMTLVMELIEITPQTEAFGFWSTPTPRHWLQDIPVAEMEAHPRNRHETLGNGPFILESMVPGESVHLVRNDNFWRGRPHLDAIVIEVIEPLMAPLAVAAGLYDISSFPQSQFTEEFRYMDNVSFLSHPMSSNSMFWLGFRMGDWDPVEGRVVPFETPRLSLPVRQAIALSIDHLSAGDALFNGLVVPTGSVFFQPRRFSWVDTSLPTFNNFDIELARQLLDDAGYVDINGDGFRDRPDGSPLVITYLAATGSPANELNREFELQTWREELGLNVVLYQDRLVAGNVHSEIRFDENISGEVDMFTFGWGFGANPNPRNTFGPETRNNQIRYTSDAWEYVMTRFDSENMWDEDFALETIQMWQEVFIEAGVAFPTNLALGLTTVNNRVANFSLEITGDRNQPSLMNSWLWALTSDTPYVRTN